MSEEMITYLIGLIPGISMIAAAIPVVIKTALNIRKISRRDSDLEVQVRKLNDKIQELLDDNAAVRKENYILRRQNAKIMTKLTGVYHPEEKEK